MSQWLEKFVKKTERSPSMSGLSVANPNTFPRNKHCIETTDKVLSHIAAMRLTLLMSNGNKS